MTKTSNKRDVYALLRSQATLLGLPRKVHMADLTKHDKEAIARRDDTNAAFVWMVSEQGTHLVWAKCKDPRDETAWSRTFNFPRLYAETVAPATVFFFGWDGVGLTRLGHAVNAEHFLRNHACSCEKYQETRPHVRSSREWFRDDHESHCVANR